MFNSEVGSQVAWLLPAALVLGVAGLWFARGRRPAQAGLTLWLGWLVVTALTFSLMAGIFHPYYTVALAPAIGALVGIGGWVLWQHRASLVAAGILGLATAVTTSLAFELLARDASWHPWLKYVVATVGFASALMIVGARHLPGRVATGVAVVALLSGLTAPAAYSLATATTPHTGSIPSAGPTTGDATQRGTPNGTTTSPRTSANGQANAGDLLDGSTSSAALTHLLEAHASSYTWVAAAVGSNSAAGYQLATQEPVMAIGGFNGSDPSPTLAQFKAWVAAGKIHYFIAGGGGLGGGPVGGGTGGGTGGGADQNTASQITSWVESTYTAETVDGVTVYDLTAGHVSR
jgi:4-amino-4-deoxy-L-arabinose transferase-like glycosyltransferase